MGRCAQVARCIGIDCCTNHSFWPEKWHAVSSLPKSRWITCHRPHLVVAASGREQARNYSYGLAAPHQLMNNFCPIFADADAIVLQKHGAQQMYCQDVVFEQEDCYRQMTKSCSRGRLNAYVTGFAAGRHC